jgi:cytidylate kinase
LCARKIDRASVRAHSKGEKQVFRVLTVAREYGSGGGRIASMIAERLNWNLLDQALIERAALAAQVEPQLAQRYDERVDPWLHRIGRNALWCGAFEGVATTVDDEIIDAERMASLERTMITEAHAKGNCVIVGRGAQCVLQDRQDALHVFVYAPFRQRVARVRRRVPEAKDVERLIRSIDQRRADHIRMYFGCNWNNPHLYHMLVSSEFGEEDAARIILDAIQPGAAWDA